ELLFQRCDLRLQDSRVGRQSGSRRHAALLRSDFLELEEQVLNLPVERVQLFRRGGEEQRVVDTPGAQEQVNVAEKRFGAVGAKRVSLLEGKLRLLDHAPLLFGSLGRGDAPVVDTSDRTAQLGERFLPIVIPNESRVAIEILRQFAPVIDLLG